MDIKAIGAHKWEVQFDFDGISKKVTSKSLLLVEGEAGVPVDELRIRSKEIGRQVRLCMLLLFAISLARTNLSFLSF